MGFWKPAIGYALILLVGISVAVGIHFDIKNDYRQARARYIDNSRADTKAAARHVEVAFRSIYENLRTISFLPSVKAIDRHGENLTPEAHTTIQHIYNNLASNVSISEVYILPVDLDPDRIDPVTGAREMPIIEFDELVVNARARRNAASKGEELDEEELERPAEEIELYEHRELMKQLAWLKINYPTVASIDGMKVPLVSSSEVITCDNTNYIHTGEDADRLGMIFSVPFYDEDGALKGAISAIVLTSVMGKMLPSDSYTIVNASRGYSSSKTLPRKASGLTPYLVPDKSLIYSETIPLNVDDDVSAWHLWAGLPDSNFTDSIEVSSIRTMEHVAEASVLGLTLCAMAGWMFVVRTISSQRRASALLEQRVEERTAEIQHIATHDTLTSLPNRRLLTDKMDALLSEEGGARPFAVHCIDLDRFKPVNNSLGHPVGDELLCCVAKRLEGCSQQGVLIARFGGDEFIVLQTDARGRKDAEKLAERMIAKLSEEFHIHGHRVSIGASVGVAMYPEDGRTSDELIRNADLALYRAKSEGRGICRAFEPAMYQEMQEAHALEVELREAIQRQQFVLHYQPLHDAKTAQLVGFEALVRWNHPERGLLLPGSFIGVAEETGLIRHLGAWILDQACVDAAEWPSDLKVAVNISPVQFGSEALPLQVVSALGNAGLPPSRLELEITESVMLAENEENMRTLHSLRRMGIRIAMDDFGTGYSALRYLRSFPFDRIKIDRSFVSRMADNPQGRAIVRAIADLARSLGIRTTAEGVETEADLALVTDSGCTDAQGHYFGYPMPLADVERMLKDRQAPAKVA